MELHVSHHMFTVYLLYQGLQTLFLDTEPVDLKSWLQPTSSKYISWDRRFKLTLTELGTKPLYNAPKPSCRTVFLNASTMPVYSSGALLLPSPATTEEALLQPTICILRRMTSSGYATVCPTVPAAAPHANRVVTLKSVSWTSPNGRLLINQSFSDSYTAKLRPTYGTYKQKWRISGHMFLNVAFIDKNCQENYNPETGDKFSIQSFQTNLEKHKTQDLKGYAMLDRFQEWNLLLNKLFSSYLDSWTS